jgi:hypothetical protein
MQPLPDTDLCVVHEQAGRLEHSVWVAIPVVPAGWIPNSEQVGYLSWLPGKTTMQCGHGSEQGSEAGICKN